MRSAILPLLFTSVVHCVTSSVGDAFLIKMIPLKMWAGSLGSENPERDRLKSLLPVGGKGVRVGYSMCKETVPLVE